MIEERRKNLPQKFISWMDRRHIVSVRSAVMGATVWLTFYVTYESFRFAFWSKMSGVEIAAVIAAVTAPVCALQGFVFSSYMKAKDGQP